MQVFVLRNECDVIWHMDGLSAIRDQDETGGRRAPGLRAALNLPSRSAKSNANRPRGCGIGPFGRPP
jgi:hypothetical protein